jgi:hypothetical protein
MDAIQREIDRLWEETEAQHDARNRHMDVARQALSWALDPKRFCAPFDYVRGIPVGSTDCLEPLRQAPLPSSSGPMSDAA